MTSIIRQADLYKAVDRWAEKGHSVTIDTTTGKIHVEPKKEGPKKDRLSGIEI